MASVFGALGQKVKSSVEEFKAKKEAEDKLDEEEDFYQKREQRKFFADDLKQRAVQYNREKALGTVNDSKIPLSKKIKAVNEHYKEYMKPKESLVPEITNQTSINRYRRDMRMEKNAVVKQLIADDKQRRIQEMAQRQRDVKERNELLKLERAARNSLIASKSKLRGIKNG